MTAEHVSSCLNPPGEPERALFCAVCSGCWKVFTGNELAALFGWWMFSRWKENCSKDADVKNVYMLATTVSSKILRAIALKEGFNFEVSGGFADVILQSKT